MKYWPPLYSRGTKGIPLLREEKRKKSTEPDRMHHLLVGVHHLIVLVVLVVQGTPLIQMTEQ